MTPDVETEVENPQTALAAAIVAAVNANQPPRKIKAAEYQRTRSVHRDKPKLTRPIYQNGYALDIYQLSKDAIEMANQIKPGIYADGLLTVVSIQEGTGMHALNITYPNKSVDERMAIKSAFPSFEHMLARILKDMKGA